MLFSPEIFRSAPAGAGDQRADQNAEEEADNPGDEEMAEGKFFSALTASALPFSGGQKLFCGFDAGADFHKDEVLWRK